MSDNKVNGSKWEGPEPANTSNKGTSGWEGGSPKTSKWEGASLKDTQWEGAAPTTVAKKKNNIAAIVIPVIAVIALIGGILYWKMSNVSHNAPASTVETTADLDNATAKEANETDNLADAKENGTAQPEKEANSTASDTETEALSETTAETEAMSEATSEAYNDSENSLSDYVAEKSIQIDSFYYDGDILKYDDSNFTSRFGIDVSKYQGNIDWSKVKNAGVEFAFIRIGYRGYGEDGIISDDPLFEDNFNGATAQGISVGVYFFSQAINDDEAREEAEYVISKLGNNNKNIPVSYDLITLGAEDGRNNNLSTEQFVRNAEVFCNTLINAGYKPVVAFNSSQWPEFEQYKDRLSNFSIWYGDYELNTQQPISYEFLQYSTKGHIDGIDTVVDLDIQMVLKENGTVQLENEANTAASDTETEALSKTTAETSNDSDEQTSHKTGYELLDDKTYINYDLGLIITAPTTYYEGNQISLMPDSETVMITETELVMIGDHENIGLFHRIHLYKEQYDDENQFLEKYYNLLNEHRETIEIKEGTINFHGNEYKALEQIVLNNFGEYSTITNRLYVPIKAGNESYVIRVEYDTAEYQYIDLAVEFLNRYVTPFSGD